MSLDHFRNETRRWLDANCPAPLRQPGVDHPICWGGKKFHFASDAQQHWLALMAAKGWTVPEWPTPYGGAGLSPAEARVVREEIARLGAPLPLQSFGIWMLAPALFKFGSEEQKLRHLPPIARGEIRWAQGYSEPNAGSDLAAIKTRCEPAGDHYIVNGQKVWTSYADEADWIFALVRTDLAAPKHLGISFVLIDMDQPGVTTRPIRLISGKSPFCETFFDDARLDADNIVGGLNKGWSVAKHLLTHEREMIGGFGASFTRPLGEWAVQKIGQDTSGRLADTMLRTDVARADIDALAFETLMAQATEHAKTAGGIGATASVLKYYGTEFNKRRHELMVSLSGTDGLEWKAEDDLAANWLRTKANSIEGGTSEVQLNIISKHLLDLPSA